MTIRFRQSVVNWGRFGNRLRRAEDGATAVEFALISVPFILILFGILSVCQLAFWIYTTENAVWTASRDLRTGAYQTNSGVYAGLSGQPLIDAFRTQVCNLTVNPSDCQANSIVQVQSNTTFASIVAPSCTVTSNHVTSLKPSAQGVFNAGGSSSVILMTLCYAWSFGGSLPFLNMTTLSNGSYLIQSSAAFVAEPF